MGTFLEIIHACQLVKMDDIQQEYIYKAQDYFDREEEEKYGADNYDHSFKANSDQLVHFALKNVERLRNSTYYAKSYFSIDYFPLYIVKNFPKKYDMKTFYRSKGSPADIETG